MRVPEAAEDAGDAVAVPDVRAVRIALAVGEAVMLVGAGAGGASAAPLAREVLAAAL